MPYDPRSVSEGGNRGIDVRFSRVAPKGKFRVIGVDTFDGGDWLEGDFDSVDEALSRARAKGGTMTMMHIYDDQGNWCKSAGSF